MAFNPRDKKQRQMQHQAIDWSYQQMEVFRQNRLAAVRQYTGTHYTSAWAGSGTQTPVNFLEIALNIYIRLVMARTPRALVTPKPQFVPRLSTEAEILSSDLDNIIKEINFEETAQEVLVEAIFSMGIVKHGLYMGRGSMIDGIWHDVGQPFVDIVDFEDFFWDMTARRREECDYMGNYFRIPYDLVMNDDYYDKKAKDGLKPTPKTSYTRRGDERVSSVGAGRGTDADEMRKYIELKEVWTPHDNMLVTYATDSEDREPLHVNEDFDGPEIGPYGFLSFSKVPGNLMPLPPVATMIDLHDLGNRIFTKLSKQAERQKTITGVQAGGDKDANTVVKANDGDVVKLVDPNNVKEFRYGGIDPGGLAMFVEVDKVFNKVSGNVESLGGLAALADTATQEKMMRSDAGERVESMRAEMRKFLKQEYFVMGWYRYYDPFMDATTTKRIPGVDEEITVHYTPEEREGDFLQFNYEIDAYSMVYKSPEQRLAELKAYLMEMAVPLYQMIASQGGEIDFRELNELYAKYSGMPEIKKILRFMGAREGGEMEPFGTPPRQSPVTERINRRISTSGASPGAQRGALQTAALGVGQQPSQAANIFGG